MQPASASPAVQFKSLCRLLCLADPAVNFLLDEVLFKSYKKIATMFEVPEGVTDSKQVDAALRRGFVKWFNVKNHYNKKDFFAHAQQQHANAWLYPDSKYLNEADSISVES